MTISTRRLILFSVVLFLAGMLAGSGLGAVYGSRTQETGLLKQITDLQGQQKAQSDKYSVLVDEYNKLRQAPVRASQQVVPVSMGAAAATPAPAQAAPAGAQPTAAQPVGAQSMGQATQPAAAKPPASAGSLAADFTADRVEIRPGMEIRFRDDTMGKVGEWLWDFGDGVTSTEQNPTHTYKDNGEFTVTLKVTGPDGTDTIQKVKFIRVSEDCNC